MQQEFVVSHIREGRLEENKALKDHNFILIFQIISKLQYKKNWKAISIKSYIEVAPNLMCDQTIRR